MIDDADTGSGLSAHELPRVSERLWHSERVAPPNRGGAGIGLAIAR